MDSLTPAQQRLADQIVAAGLADEASASAAIAASRSNPSAEQQIAAWKRAMGQRVKNLPPDAPAWRFWDAKKEGRL